MENPQTLRKKTNFNYGLRGWLICLYCMIGFMTIGGAFWMGAAQNTMVAIKAEQIGVDSASILSANSLAGLFAIIALLGIGILFGRYKTRIMHTVIMILCGITLIFYGSVSNMVGYIIIFLMLDAFSNGASTVGLPQIAAAYFPTKKGSFLGWATIGSNLAALVSFGILNWLITKQSVQFATTCFGIFTIAMGLINWFLIPSNPVTNWIFMACFFFWTGANANLVMSHAASTFGPRDYPRLWGRMAPVYTLMRIFAPMVLSIFLNNSASSLLGYRNSYTFFGCAAILALILIFFTDQTVFKKPGEAPTGVTKA